MNSNYRVRSDNYILIPGWAVVELNLKGVELLVYSIIYGFSQNSDCQFTGSLSYLCAWCNCSRQQVINCLKSLVEKGLIVKIENVVNNVKFPAYKVIHII